MSDQHHDPAPKCARDRIMGLLGHRVAAFHRQERQQVGVEVQTADDAQPEITGGKRHQQS